MEWENGKCNHRAPERTASVANSQLASNLHQRIRKKQETYQN